MLKKISKLGKALDKAGQKTISGGKRMCGPHCPCPTGQCCLSGVCHTLCP